MIEKWKDIEGYKGFYQISNLGNLKSLSRPLFNGRIYFMSNEIIKKTRLINSGYLVVDLIKNRKSKTKTIHRLVSTYFIKNKNKDKFTETNHIDGNKQNNVSTNLEWVTPERNLVDAYERGVRKCKARISVIQKNKDGSIIEIFKSIKAASRKTKCDDSNIARCCNKIYKHCGGFVWEYAE